MSHFSQSVRVLRVVFGFLSVFGGMYWVGINDGVGRSDGMSSSNIGIILSLSLINDMSSDFRSLL